MFCPEMGDVRLKALIDRVHSERGKELKEAIPLPPKLVVALEVVLPKLRVVEVRRPCSCRALFTGDDA